MQPPGQGQAQGVTARDVGTASGLDVCVLGSACTVWIQVPERKNPALSKSRLSGLSAVFTPAPRFCGAPRLLELDGLCKQQAVQSDGPPAGFKLPSCGSYCLWHVCGAGAAGCQGGGIQWVCLLCLTRLDLEKVTKQMGQARAL